MVSLMTALWFAHLEAPDRVSVKPHASPVLHAINFLLGRLDPAYLPRLREYGGLQSYPSRTKDPDPVDYSTGSVGIGATATIWGALAHRYVAGHFDVPRGGRQIALLGDAELDEGAVWEAIVDPMVARLGEVLWVVDLNRQSLDRVVPDIAAGRLVGMFEAAGWHTETVKYGRRLRALFEHDGGEALRARIDAMGNEEYQRLLRADDAQLRERLPAATPAIARAHRRPRPARAAGRPSATSAAMTSRPCSPPTARPTQSATARRSSSPTRSRAGRCPPRATPPTTRRCSTTSSSSTSPQQLGTDPREPVARLRRRLAPRAGCAPRRRRGSSASRSSPTSRRRCPSSSGASTAGRARPSRRSGACSSTSTTMRPRCRATSSPSRPDVASSTNLGGWINRSGIWSIGERIDWFADDSDTLVRWRESDHGRHVELGIAEVNLVGLLGELGATWSRDGRPLLPVGTIYDPFVMRAHEPWSFGIYAGGQSILVGTPSGDHAGARGRRAPVGRHAVGRDRAAGLRGVGAGLHPGLRVVVPARARRAGARGRQLGLLPPVDAADRPGARARCRPRAPSASSAARDVLAGGYRLREGERVTIVAVGAVVPEALEAAEELDAEVVCLTSPDLVFRALQARAGLADADHAILERLFPAPRPLVTVLDGHPHTLAFLAGVHGAPIACLGVAQFGQSGDIADLYRHHGVDAETIVGAALDLT